MVNTGRPRDSAIDDAILGEAARMVVENGYGATSIDAVARAAGTTRPAVYRRYASLAQIVAAAMASRVRFSPQLDAQDLMSDLLDLQRAQVAFFGEPLVVKAMPGLIDEGTRNESLRNRMHEDVMAPRRAAVRRALDAAIARGEITGGDETLIADLLTGPLLLRTLMPELGPMDDVLVSTTVSAALNAVGLDHVEVARAERA